MPAVAARAARRRAPARPATATTTTTIYANNGTAVGDVDRGAGIDTIVIDPYHMKGGVSNAQALREGRISNCERVIEAPPSSTRAAGSRRSSPTPAAGAPAATATTT